MYRHFTTTVPKNFLCPPTKKSSSVSTPFLKQLSQTICAIKTQPEDYLYSLISPKRKKHIYSQEESDIVLDFAKHHLKGLSIVLLLSLGLRRSELLGLKWSDVDFENRTIHIQRAVTPINNRSTIGSPKTPTSVRVLPIEESLCKYLQEQCEGLPPASFVIGSKENFCSISNWVHHYFDPFVQDLEKDFPELPKLTPHEYRHTCGTLLYRRTKNIYAVSKFLGHSDVVITTKIYVHNDVEALRADLSVSDI